MYWTDPYTLQLCPLAPILLRGVTCATGWDAGGKNYIDFAGGFYGASLGFANAPWAESIMDQALRLGQAPGIVANLPVKQLSMELCTRSGMHSAFFTSSGTGGTEAMVRLARSYSHSRYGAHRQTVLTLPKANHGESLSMAAASDPRPIFAEPGSGFRLTQANIDSIEAQSKEGDVCAVLIELLQPGGTLDPIHRPFLHALVVLCAEQDWLLLVDEVHTGIGRCGSLFLYQQYGILPDAVSFGSSLSGGLPMGGMLLGSRFRDVLEGLSEREPSAPNPVCAAAALSVLDQLNETTLAQVRDKGDYLRSGLEALHLNGLGRISGAGLFLGVATPGVRHSRDLAYTLCSQGLLCLSTWDGLLFAPPLLIKKEELDQGLAILHSVMEKGETEE